MDAHVPGGNAESVEDDIARVYDELLSESDEAEPAALSGVVTRGASLAGAGYVITQVFTFAAYLALARLATPADFGQFAAGAVVVNAGTVLGESGIQAALLHRRQQLEAAFNSAFVATLLGGVALTLATLAAAPLVGLFFHSHKTGVVAAVMAGTMMLRMLSIVPDSLLMRRFSFARRVFIDPLTTIFFAAGAIPAAAAGLGVWALVIGTYAAAVLDVAAAWVFARWRPRPRLARREIWRELARFGRPVVGGNLIRRLVQEIPVLALGRFSGAGALGQFTYATRISTQALGAVVNVGGYVLLPAFSRLSVHDERFRTAVRTALRWLCILSFPASMLLVPLGTPAVVLIFGEQWRVAGHAAMALGVYCAALGLDSIASEAWKANARTDMLPRMHGVSLLLTIVFVGALVHFGVVGVAIGLSAAALGVAVYAVRGMSHALGIELADLVREIWPPAVAASLMAGALFCLEHFVVHAARHGLVGGLALLVAETLIGAALYLALLAAIAPASARQLLIIARAQASGLGDKLTQRGAGAA
ncbi:MAG: oligosaccharide flippase family protein [Solirubrobacteraceae bacterium]